MSESGAEEGEGARTAGVDSETVKELVQVELPLLATEPWARVQHVTAHAHTRGRRLSLRVSSLPQSQCLSP